jgi:hypothetical protein
MKLAKYELFWVHRTNWWIFLEQIYTTLFHNLSLQLDSHWGGKGDKLEIMGHNKILKAARKISCTKIFPWCKILGRNESFPTFIICPKLSSSVKFPRQTAHKFLSILEKLSQEFYKLPLFFGSIKKAS